MIKRLFILLAILFAPVANAAEMVNVEYIHAALQRHWGVSLPYNSALTNPRVAANMKYLLTAVDRMNEVLNGKDITNYGDDPKYATLAAADTVATKDAIARLVKQSFYITTTPDTASFSFEMSAQGRFYITWGDGTTDVIERNNTEKTIYSHTYEKADAYKIGFSGRATAYSTENSHLDPAAALQFRYNDNIAAIEGSLGAIFGTIGDGSQPGQQPTFRNTFRQCSNLSSTIPENLFEGVHGAPIDWMFAGTFQGSPFYGSIPAGLFSGIKGAPVYAMFNNTFVRSALTGSIPKDLFAGIKGAPAQYMFAGTFDSVYGLSGEIPAGLFAGIKGAPAQYMYHYLFFGDLNLTGEIPENLFGDISGDAADFMFRGTFWGCTGLTGQSARINGKYLYEIWPSGPTSIGELCYYNAPGLSDYATMPGSWK